MDSNKVLCYPGVGQLHQQAPTAPRVQPSGAPPAVQLAHQALCVNR